MQADENTLTTRLRSIRDSLKADLVERDDAVQLSLLAALAGEHMLLVGPPGTAKSMVARRLKLAIQNGDCFEYLLTRFTVPDELFGPLSIKGLEEDRYRRITENRLPRASVAFLDEIFKANSAILNALLTLLNEREFDNDGRREKTPLISLIGASNELPQGEDLSALYDRFLLRLHLDPVTKEGFEKLLDLNGETVAEVAEGLRLSPEELVDLQQRALTVALPVDVRAMLRELRTFLQEQQILVSDRRWRQVVKLLRISALSNGKEEVSVWDCWLIQHMVWEKAEQREIIYNWYAERVGNQEGWSPETLTRIVSIWEGKLEREQGEREQIRDKKGNLLFRTPDGKETSEAKGEVRQRRGDKPLYIAPKISCDERGGQLPNLTNDGKGYTIEQLKNLSYKDDRYYNRRSLSTWEGLSTFIKTKDSHFMQEEAFAPSTQPRHYPQVEIDHNLQQIDEHISDIEAWLEKMSIHLEGLEQNLQQHLWVPDRFMGPASERLRETESTVKNLRARLLKVRQGLGDLPVRATGVEM